ncbi:hypothetical protein PHYBLDRAFT_162999 [Phycomyces blakesleeanus NRRL 1555(-)]|uniref:Uncharacterized protein n=1 Tax=Phycomyces blakesleeanus (strain ATCC 8743b / DSM 1359 / FGSC 10004 / NBRC 33097 / NRRL 1555) TaxID=763407 RepID=A0A167QMY3_PHYB8|nr:hypothetical protein PHYBLDRAFT_162999 [Phycomyces blakesleeanus NRRL 1555(-)]OAD79950.1 hypothetical protein PHYBLDRAFT_162999 [Phycomyces blakesleeanus NRRL 1555(-)]|eukprot:XP_018297990.1 hypothetical protein PHYBLDRAFT_162999 [Phycomyces blakesleeanus NRRL 1555(-)]
MAMVIVTMNSLFRMLNKNTVVKFYWGMFLDPIPLQKEKKMKLTIQNRSMQLLVMNYYIKDALCRAFWVSIASLDVPNYQDTTIANLHLYLLKLIFFEGVGDLRQPSVSFFVASRRRYKEYEMYICVDLSQGLILCTIPSSIEYAQKNKCHFLVFGLIRLRNIINKRI